MTIEAGVKRKANDRDETKVPSRESPYIPVFEQFRIELDEHHDRRERTLSKPPEMLQRSRRRCESPTGDSA